MYLAEEAVGLVRSLNWVPFEGLNKIVEPGSESDIDSESGSDLDAGEVKRGRLVRRGSQKLSIRQNIQNMKKENIKDGDYVYAPELKGVYFVLI